MWLLESLQNLIKYIRTCTSQVGCTHIHVYALIHMHACGRAHTQHTHTHIHTAHAHTHSTCMHAHTHTVRTYLQNGGLSFSGLHADLCRSRGKLRGGGEGSESLHRICQWLRGLGTRLTVLLRWVSSQGLRVCVCVYASVCTPNTTYTCTCVHENYM